MHEICLVLLYSKLISRFSLENLNIIQIGKKSQFTKEHYPVDLVKQTEAICKEVPNYFLHEDVDFYNNIFDIIESNADGSQSRILFT